MKKHRKSWESCCWNAFCRKECQTKRRQWSEPFLPCDFEQKCEVVKSEKKKTWFSHTVFAVSVVLFCCTLYHLSLVTFAKDLLYFPRGTVHWGIAEVAPHAFSHTVVIASPRPRQTGRCAGRLQQSFNNLYLPRILSCSWSWSQAILSHLSFHTQNHQRRPIWHMLDIFVTILWHQDHEKIAGMRFSSHISQQSAAVLSHGKYSMNLYSFNRYFCEIPSKSLHSFNVIYVMLRHLLAQFPGESIGWSTGQSGRHEQCQHRICWDVLTWSFWNSKSVGSKTCLKVRKHLLLGRSVSSWFFILFLCNLSPMSLSGEDPEFRSGLPLNFSHIMGSWCAGWNAIQPKWLKCDFDIPWFSVLHLFRLAAVSPGTSSGAACFKFVVVVNLKTAIWNNSLYWLFYCILFFAVILTGFAWDSWDIMRHFLLKKCTKTGESAASTPRASFRRKAKSLLARLQDGANQTSRCENHKMWILQILHVNFRDWRLLCSGIHRYGRGALNLKL